MKLPETDRKRFEEHRAYVEKHERGLLLDVNWVRGYARITGLIPVHVGAGVTREFQIAVEYSGLDPFALPTTRDGGNAFPPDIDRHIFPDGGFCMWLPQTAPTDFGEDDGLALHLDRVREFLLLQVMYDDNVRRGRSPAWPGEQWAHGEEGHREWVRQQVVGLAPKAIGRLTAYAAVPKPDHVACPCGSGSALGLCHGSWTTAMHVAMRALPGVTDELLRLAGLAHA